MDIVIDENIYYIYRALKQNKIINKNIALPNSYNVRNTLEIAQELTQVKLTKNHRIMTLDIKDLYVNIPVEDIIHSIEFWFQLQSRDVTMLNQIKKLLRTVLQQNYFHYEGTYYKPMKGIAMGSPISSLASELILQYHENRTIKLVRNRTNQIL
jgi:hypothetical protein